MNYNYLEELNDNQRNAVEYINGPSLVIAGAGSGKTRVLTYKIMHLLLAGGLQPWSILALTFTNKAAREMKERISQIAGKDVGNRLWMGTFHSIFSRILRTEASYIGYNERYTIYDQSDSRNLVKSIIKEMGLDEKKYKPAHIACQISNAKNRLITSTVYASDAGLRKADEQSNIALTYEIYKRYAERCRLANAMDFDDLLLNTYLLFNQYPEICKKYSDLFEYVLVDEYQDTNYAQHAIIWQLTNIKKRVCVVGDDAQSIYSFRGANIENILSFSKIFNGTKIFKLEQNYRSTQTIVNAANSVISHNEHRIPKVVYSKNKEGEPITLQVAYSDLEEADIVVRRMQHMHQRDAIEFNEMAVLYRTNAQSRTFEEAMRKRNIPYVIYGGLSFYQRKEIKDVIAYCRLCVNPYDEEAFKRILNYPARGIGQTTEQKILSCASDNGVSLWDVLCNLDKYQLSVNKGTLSKLHNFTSLIQTFIEQARSLDAAAMLQQIISSTGIMKEFLSERTPENMSRQENIEELINGVHEFVRSRKEEGLEKKIYIADFLQEVSLLSDLEEDAQVDDSKVTMMTVHSAKGLEFRCIFIVGMEEELFPNSSANGNKRELEEERRLFYVALTRAKERCFITYARSRFKYGKTEFCNPSRFLMEIDRKYIHEIGNSIRQYHNSNHIEVSSQEPFQSSSIHHIISSQNCTNSIPRTTLRPLKKLNIEKVSSTNDRSIDIGQHIEHERFGIGEVIGIEGNGDNCKATVRFANCGTKQLLLRFARFKLIE